MIKNFVYSDEEQENKEPNAIADERLNDGQAFIPVSLNDLQLLRQESVNEGKFTV